MLNILREIIVFIQQSNPQKEWSCRVVANILPFFNPHVRDFIITAKLLIFLPRTNDNGFRAAATTSKGRRSSGWFRSLFDDRIGGKGVEIINERIIIAFILFWCSTEAEYLPAVTRSSQHSVKFSNHKKLVLMRPGIYYLSILPFSL